MFFCFPTPIFPMAIPSFFVFFFPIFFPLIASLPCYLCYSSYFTFLQLPSSLFPSCTCSSFILRVFPLSFVFPIRDPTPFHVPQLSYTIIHLLFLPLLARCVKFFSHLPSPHFVSCPCILVFMPSLSYNYLFTSYSFSLLDLLFPQAIGSLKYTNFYPRSLFTWKRTLERYTGAKT